MTKRSLTRKLAIAAASALAMVTVADTSAVAGSTTILDPSGVDYDAACIVPDPTAPVGGPNRFPSPYGHGCSRASLYDGSTESTDIRKVSLSTNGVSSGPWSNTQLVASCELEGVIPRPGSTTPPTLGSVDLPSNLFTGAGCKVLFQDPARQTNTPYVAATKWFGTPIFGLNEHWMDGFHLWIGFDVDWDGAQWIHSAKIGTYDPSPTGGFFFQELGVSRSPGVWDAADPCMPYGTTWSVATGPGTVTVTVDGVTRFSSILAVGGCIVEEHVKAGDTVSNVSGLTSADVLAVLPVTVPTSFIPGFANITTVGGFMFFSDVTGGNSRNTGTGAALAMISGDNPTTSCNNEGILGNVPCISYSHGLAGRPLAGEWLDVRPDRELWGIGASMPDTLGRGPRCWTYTMGATLPTNPLWVPNQPCHVDDDNIPGPSGNFDPGERGTFLPEFWDTNYGFTA